MERGHLIILRTFLSKLRPVRSILDAGSGKTSLSAITAAFPDAEITAVIYPGDTRKAESVKAAASDNIALKELDLCCDEVPGRYDLVTAHLLLGEASKFGHTCSVLLARLLAIPSQYYIIIDYLEDPDVDEEAIPRLCQNAGITVLERMYVENTSPQIWESFVGAHNFGYLIEKKSGENHGKNP